MGSRMRAWNKFGGVLVTLILANCGAPSEQRLPEPSAEGSLPTDNQLTETPINASSPATTITPASDPPIIGVLTSSPALFAGPSQKEDRLGIYLDEGELVEILLTTDEWMQIRWLSPQGTEVTGWVQNRWVGIPTPMPPTPDLENLPSFEEAMTRNDIIVTGGDTYEDIISAYGEPSKDEMSPNFNPPIMRSVSYHDLDLKFLLNKDIICCIEAYDNFDGEVFGLKIGDYISKAIAIFGDDYEEFETAAYNVGMCDGYHWLDKLPNWHIKAKDGFIVEFGYFDREIYGPWSPELP
jgi:hypothetical protein